MHSVRTPRGTRYYIGGRRVPAARFLAEVFGSPPPVMLSVRRGYETWHYATYAPPTSAWSVGTSS